MEARRTCGTWAMVTFCATQSWLGAVQPAGLRRRQRQNRSGAGTTENRRHLLRERLGCSASRVEDPRRAEHDQGFYSNHWKHHARSCCRWARQTPFELCTNVYSCVRTRRRNLPFSESVLRVLGHTVLQEHRAAEIHDEIGQRSLERLFPGFTEDSMVQVTLSGGQSGIGYKRARDVASPVHLGALTAAKRCIQAVIQDGVTAGLLPKQPLETRLAAVIETALSTYLDALDDEDKATAKLYVQKAAQAADEAWQQTVGGLQGPASQNRQQQPSNIPAPLSGRGQRRHGLLSALEKPTQFAAAPSAAFTVD